MCFSFNFIEPAMWLGYGFVRKSCQRDDLTMTWPVYLMQLLLDMDVSTSDHLWVGGWGWEESQVLEVHAQLVLKGKSNFDLRKF